jgi:hypothetical protein
MKKKLVIFLLIIFIFGNYIGINFLITSNNYFANKIRHSIPQQGKNFLKEIDNRFKKIFFVFAENRSLKLKIDQAKDQHFSFVDKIDIFKFSLTEDFKIEKNNFKIKKYQNLLLSSLGPRAYLQIYKNNIFLITGTGSIMFANLNDFEKENIFFKKIESNFFDLVFRKYVNERTDVVKNILIDNGVFIISYMKKKNPNCYMTALLSAKINLKKMVFNELYDINECQPYFDDLTQTGGNLSSFKDNKILLTIGDWNSYDRQKNSNPQNVKSLVGKIISVDLATSKAKIISSGHRNSQGLYYDKKENIIFSTDHGPQGGDEINLHRNPNVYKNFGWGVSSYG